MRNFFSRYKKTTIVAVLAAIVLVVGGVALFTTSFDWLFPSIANPELPEKTDDSDEQPIQEVVGASVQGRDIEVFYFGDGPTRLLFAGGIHGGYEWNSSLLAYELIDYFKANPEVIPQNITVAVIPALNPDAVYNVAGTSKKFTLADVPLSDGPFPDERFNANGVDLNRNFNCNWKPTAIWRGEVVSAGDEPFSEPEAKATRDFILNWLPEAAIFLHSQAGAVYGSQCGEGTLPETIEIMNVYAESADYRAIEKFDAYPITGDVEGWLAKIGIPAISVELTTHQVVELEQNIRGVGALLDYYARK